jgi:pyruvate-formate lyase
MRAGENAKVRPQWRHLVFSKKTNAWQAVQWKVFTYILERSNNSRQR